MNVNDRKKAQKISNAFRTSAAGVKLGRMLFDPGLQGKINPAQIASLLRQAGVPIPQEVTVGLQAAQLIMSGGTLAAQLSSGAMSVMQIGQASANYISALIAFFKTVGILEDSIAVRTVQMGVDLVLVCASEGANVYADLALAMDIMQAALFPPDERPQVIQALDRLNHQNAKSWIFDRTRTQINAAHQLIADYQDKKISMFEFIGEFAIQSGDAFPNYFPEYKVFIPPRTLTKSFVSEQEANHGGFLFIGRQTDLIRRVLNVDVTTTAGTSHRDVVRGFISKFITDPFAPYFYLQNKMQGKIDFTALACLSVLSDDFDVVPENFDIIPTLQKLLLMPDDISYSNFRFSQLGYKNQNNFLSNELYNALKGNAYAQAGISLNGIPLDEKATARNKQIELDNYSRKLALKCEAEGDILTLTKIPLVRDILRKWGQLPSFTKAEYDKLPAFYRVTDAGANLDYRNIQNFFSVVSVIDAMNQDAWLNKYGDYADLIEGLSWIIPMRDQMEAYFEKMFNLSTFRYINAKSRQNVANFYGTSLDKIDFKNNPDGTAFIVPKGTK